MLISKPYNRERAVEYARTWALSRNPLFIDFTGSGGNCTNFVSQGVLAGRCSMNYTPDFGWYYISAEDRAPAWSGVEYFYDFMTGSPRFASQNGGVGPVGREVERERAEIGDPIQYANREGDWYHTVIISGFENGEILVCAQSDNALDRPLSSYNFASARFIHIEEVRMEINDDRCYEILLAGEVPETEAPPPPLPEQPNENPEAMGEELENGQNTM